MTAIPLSTLARLLKATKFATEAHGNQSRKARKSKHVPYMVHPLEVCQIILDGLPSYSFENSNYIPEHQRLPYTEAMLIAALLHDVLEDTDKTDRDIEMLFGKTALKLVQELTDNKDLTKEQQRAEQLDHMLTASFGARCIKVADKTSNLRDLVRCPPGWKLSSVRGYVEHATQVVCYASKNQDIPQPLIEEFWKARQIVFDWIAEQELLDSNIT